MRQKHNEGSLAMRSRTSDGGALAILSEKSEGVHWSRRAIAPRNQESEVGALAVTNQRVRGRTGHDASYDGGIRRPRGALVRMRIVSQ